MSSFNWYFGHNCEYSMKMRMDQITYIEMEIVVFFNAEKSANPASLIMTKSGLQIAAGKLT